MVEDRVWVKGREIHRSRRRLLSRSITRTLQRPPPDRKLLSTSLPLFLTMQAHSLSRSLLGLAQRQTRCKIACVGPK